jgi:putative ATP-binding cassette transporter
MFLPQRPYLPLGTLRAALTYPSPPGSFADEAVRAAVRRVGLEEFLPLLDEEQRWDQELSLGEQQRVSFARLLLQRPKWAFLDEATAALDEANEVNLMSVFDQELAGTTVVSIGHHPSLESFHTQKLRLFREPGGARLRPA